MEIPVTFSWQRFLVFFCLLLAVSLPVQLPALLSGNVGDGLIIVIMWAPGLAALLTRLILDRTLRGFAWGLGVKPGSTALIALLTPLVVCILAYGPLWITGVVPINTGGYSAVIGKEFGMEGLGFLSALLVVVTAGLLLNSFVVLGEEIGWRGFLFPILADRYGPRLAAVATGLIWSTWHIPGILLGGYNAGGPVLLSIACFTVSLTGLSVIAGVLVQRSSSLWPAVVIHASHNLFFQAVFDQLTVRNDGSVLLTTEWGLGTAFVYGAFGLWGLRYLEGK